jgi:Na+/proline symporter
MESRSLVILSCVTAYMLMCIGVGIWAMRRTRSTKDFFVAGRSLGVMVVGLAVFSSQLSGFGFVGGPGLVYRMGMSSVWLIVCASIGHCLTFYLVAKRLRLMAELRDSVSLPDTVAARYNSEMSRFLTSVAILMGVMGYLATQILAMATVLRDIVPKISWLDRINEQLFGLAKWGSETFHLPMVVQESGLEVYVVMSCAVLVFYCVTGGIIASVYTDLVQGAVMVLAAVLVLVAAVAAASANLDGSGFAAMSTEIIQDDREAIGPWGTLGVMGSLSWLFVFAMGAMGQPHVITKMMMYRNVRDARSILVVSLVGFTLAALLWISIGMVMRALVLAGTHPELDAPDSAAGQFLQHYAHPLLAGIVFAGLFAAIMSTADGFLNIGAAAVVHDIPKAISGRSLNRELFWARTATIAIALLAALIALYSGEKLVALLGAFGWGTFAAALVPAIAIGLNWKRATATAVNATIIVSLTLSIGLKFAPNLWPGFAIPWGIDGGAIALLISLTLFFGISLCSKPPRIDADVEAVMDM